MFRLHSRTRSDQRWYLLLGAATAVALLAAAGPAQARQFVYATNSGPFSDVSQYEVGAGGLLAPLVPSKVTSVGTPIAVAMSPDGQSVYVASYFDSNLSQYDVGPGGALSPKSPATVAAGDNSRGVAVSPDDANAYVTNSGDNSVSQYDVGLGGALQPKGPATVAVAAPFGVAVSPNGHSVYVTNFLAAGTVSQYNVGAGGALQPKSPATVASGRGPIAVAVSPDGRSVYVANSELSNSVSQYDVGPGGVLSPKSPATVASDIGPQGVAVSPDGRSVYVTNESNRNDDLGTLSQYDVGPGGVLSPKSPATVVAGNTPRGVVVSPDGHSVYVANVGAFFGDNISQYDVGPGGALSPKSPATVGAGADPYAIAAGPDLTSITGGPNGVTNDPTPTFRFSSFDPGASFQCKLDSRAYSACSSPRTAPHLTDGPHTFSVRAKDSEGNVDPTPAFRTFTVRTAAVGLSGSTLVVTAAPGAKDNLAITQPSASTVHVTDFPGGAYVGSGVHTGAGCTRSGDYAANCTGFIARIQITAGEKADRVVNSTTVQSLLYGGPAKDTLQGGSSGDILSGGPGADAINGTNGNDLLLARDLTSDQTIDCDGGSADRADLDLPPKDPNSVVKDCETKRRY